MTQQLDAKGFFQSLLDVSFTHFVTTKIIKVLYVLAMVVILLAGLMYLIAGLTTGGVIALVSIVLVPIVTLISVVYARVILEFVVVVFRISEHTAVMAQAAAGNVADTPTWTGTTADADPALGSEHPEPPSHPAG
jgi:hypothetical protein